MLVLTSARELRSAGENTFGITIATDAFKLELKLLMEHIELIESQIKQIDQSVSGMVSQMNAIITSIGDVLGASIILEIRDISRFGTAKKLVANAGLNASNYQSGQFKGTMTSITKRGLPYLRQAIWSAALLSVRSDPVMAEYYRKEVKEGKHAQEAIGVCDRKLIHLIYYNFERAKTI